MLGHAPHAPTCTATDRHAPAQPTAADASPSVQVGMLRVCRNGNMRLRVGCCDYVLQPGVQPPCRTEVHIINTATKDVVCVAENCASAVAALDVEALIAHIAASSSHRSADGQLSAAPWLAVAALDVEALVAHVAATSSHRCHEKGS